MTFMHFRFFVAGLLVGVAVGLLGTFTLALAKVRQAELADLRAELYLRDAQIAQAQVAELAKR